MRVSRDMEMGSDFAVLTMDGKNITDECSVTSLHVFAPLEEPLVIASPFHLSTSSDEPVVIVSRWEDDDDIYLSVGVVRDNATDAVHTIRLSHNGDPWGVWDEFPVPISDHPDVVRLWPRIVAALNPPTNLISKWIEIAKRGGNPVPEEVVALVDNWWRRIAWLPNA